MGKISSLTVICASPKAIGKATKGDYNDGGKEIVASVAFAFDGPNPTTGPQGLQLLKQECSVQAVVDGKRVPEKTYVVTKLKGDTTYTFTRK
jgi:hypothetical protein